MKSPPLKILTIQYKQLGDTVVSIPSLVAIRQRFPDCELHALVPDFCAPLLQHHPAVNRVWAVPRTRGKARLRQFWPILRALRAERFDRAVDLAGNDRSAITAWLSGARERLGVVPENGFWGRRFCYSTTVPAAPQNVPETRRLLHVLSPWGISGPPTIDLKLYTDPALTSPLSRDPSKPTIICNTGAASQKKQWPVANWAALHQLATARGYDVWYTRGISAVEEQLIRDLQKLVPGAKILPKLEIPSLLVALKSADAVISNDTGPMHFAAALGVKTIGIFGPSPVQRWSPVGAHTRILVATDCICVRGTFVCLRANHCLAGITPEAVLAKLEELLPAGVPVGRSY